MGRVEVIPVKGIPWVEGGDDLASIILHSVRRSRIELENGDILVVKQKIVSKAEGRLVKLKSAKPRRRAFALAKSMGKDPRMVQLVLDESKRIVRAGYGVIVAETKHGFICANAGIDRSNVRKGAAVLLPVEPDASAKKMRVRFEKQTGRRLAVIISDTFGRPWRLGQTDVAIGCSGIAPLYSYLGRKDKFGNTLKVTMPAVVDEVAAAAELVIGKLEGVPVAIVRGVRFTRSEEGISGLILKREKDLFNWTR